MVAAEGAVERAGLGRLGAGVEILPGYLFSGAKGSREVAGTLVDLEFEDSFRKKPRRRRATPLVDFPHHRGPVRHGEPTSLRIRLDRGLLVESHPDPPHQV